MNCKFLHILISSIISLTFPGVLVVVYRKVEESTEFLLVKSRHSNAVTFPSGVLNWGESYIQTAQRELLEETGLIMNHFHLLPFTHDFSYNSLPFKPRSRQKIFLSEDLKDTKLIPNDVDIIWAKWVPENEVLRSLTYRELQQIFIKIKQSRQLRMQEK